MTFCIFLASGCGENCTPMLSFKPYDFTDRADSSTIRLTPIYANKTATTKSERHCAHNHNTAPHKQNRKIPSITRKNMLCFLSLLLLFITISLSFQLAGSQVTQSGNATPICVYRFASVRATFPYVLVPNCPHCTS